MGFGYSYKESTSEYIGKPIKYVSQPVTKQDIDQLDKRLEQIQVSLDILIKTIEGQNTRWLWGFKESDSVSNIPDNCKTCSNHPSNGGSGICHCILGGTTIT